jgi:tRNA threonylcarbamoyladenosine biosynthesis protein TsaB
MALLLNIDTATEHASVCISRDGIVLAYLESLEQKNHASFVQPAIQQLVSQSGIGLSEIHAIAVTSGPGSYTGLRVGFSSAKGVCYALNKPLITIGTLDTMFRSMLRKLEDEKRSISDASLFAPMIDARRMEVFTAVFQSDGSLVSPVQALILEPASFRDILAEKHLFLSGSGAAKCVSLLTHPRLEELPVQHDARDMVALAESAFENGHFADLAYSEPDYGKAFFTPTRSH